VDLGVQLATVFGGTTPAVQSFAMSQDADGSIWLVVAAASNRAAPSSLFVSGKLSSVPGASAWRGLTFTQRPLPPGAVVASLEIGTADDTGQPPFVVAAAQELDGMMAHYQINPDPAGSWSWYPLPLPQNATACLGVAMGTNEKLGRGVYALLQLETLRNVVFTTFPEDFGGHMVVSTIEMKLADGFQPAAIASVVVENGNTELFVGGNGLYRYSVSAQETSNLPGTQIADATIFGGVTELLAVADPSRQSISVWGQNASDQLAHTVGTRATDDEDYVWEPPVYQATEVTTFAAFRADVAGATPGLTTAALLVGKTDGSLAVLVQEPSTGLWQRQTVSVETADAALELKTYTTRLVVTDDSNVPWANQTVTLRPSVDCAALVNGEFYALRASVPKAAVTDPTGVLTIVLESPDLTAPTYEVMLNGASTTSDPAAATKSKLRAITQGSQIATAVRSDGKQLFPDGADAQSCDAAATALAQLMQAHDALPSAPAARLAGVGATRRRPTPALAVRRSVHVRLTADGAHLVSPVPQGAGAPQGTAGVADVDLWAAAGDLLAALESGAQAVTDFWIEEAEDGWRFVVDLGNRLIGFVFEVADQAIAAVNWVLKNTLGITLDDIVAWLGFVFNWGDILQNHRVIAHIVDLGLGQIVSGISDLKAKAGTAFDAVRSALGGGRIPVDTNAEPFSSQVRKGTDPGPGAESPEAHWGSQQFRDNSARASVAPVTLASIEGLFSSLTEAEAQVVQDAISQIQSRVVDQFDQMSFAEMVELVGEIVGTVVIDTAENMIDTTLDAVGLLLPSVQALMSARWDIPVITWLYEEVICDGDGSKLSLLDLVALLAAIPSTVIAKVATGRNLFPDATAQAVLRATTWEDLLDALRSPTAAHSRAPALATAATTSADVAAAALQLVAGATRTTSMAIFILREFGGFADAIRNRLQLAKVSADWVTYVLSVTSLGVLGPQLQQNPRQKIDEMVSLLAILNPGKDSYLIWYSFKNNGEACPIEDLLRYFDVVTGLGIVIAVCVSIGFEAQEAPPSGINELTWKILMAYKFAQNCMTGLYNMCNFTQAVPFSANPQVKFWGNAVRATTLAIRAYMSIARSTMQLIVGVADIDD
jgi:hypothetical protein